MGKTPQWVNRGDGVQVNLNAPLRHFNDQMGPHAKKMFQAQPRRPTVAYLLRCLESDEELVAFTWQEPKELAAALKKDGLSDYSARKIRKLVSAGDGKGYKAKPWQEIKKILLKFR